LRLLSYNARPWLQHLATQDIVEQRSQGHDKVSRACLHRSLCHVGTFLYVSLEVTSNMMIAHCPWILQQPTHESRSPGFAPNTEQSLATSRAAHISSTFFSTRDHQAAKAGLAEKSLIPSGIQGRLYLCLPPPCLETCESSIHSLVSISKAAKLSPAQQCPSSRSGCGPCWWRSPAG